MSPASSGNLEVERYIGACLISQNRPKHAAASRARGERAFAAAGRDRYGPDAYLRPHAGFGPPPRCPPPADGWAGGMPLISFASRRGRRGEPPDAPAGAERHQASPLARLAVHTQGAPLILAKSTSHRKNKVNRNGGGASTRVFENSAGTKKHGGKCQEQQQQQAGNNSAADTVSVTSDESSGSANSENCLPRIIKPRKRRKKDRKPPLLGRPLSQDGFSTDSASPDVDSGQPGAPALGPFAPPFAFDPFSFYRPADSPRLIDRCHILGDISETPKLHHSFEDIEELDDGKDVNGNQPASTCQCRYCDPSGQIWDVDRNCYSPFLTPPDSHGRAFRFLNLNLAADVPYAAPVEDRCLVHGMSFVSLEDEDKKKLPPSRSSSSSSCRDLEVSTEIVTSLNGHRDLEIKFFSAPPPVVDGATSAVRNDDGGKPCAGDSAETGKTNTCAAVNNECNLVSEE